MDKPVYIVDAARTAIGSFLGSLKAIPAHALTVELIKAVVKRNDLDPNNISEVILGQVLTGGDGQNPARQAVIMAGLPHRVPGLLVNQVCGSGLRSVVIAAQGLSNNGLIIAGGQENMSLSRHALYMRERKMGDETALDMMLSDGLIDAFNNYHMGITAENLAKKYNITREEQDQFALASHQKASKAQKEGRFKDEIIPIPLKKGGFFEEDEFIRHDANFAALNNLKPAFMKDNGTVTAGNSSGLNDGAAIVLVTDDEGLKSHSLTPMARIVSYGVSGVDPSIMGIGPVEATKLAIARANWKLEDIDLIEANEAFAAQSLAVTREIKWDTSKLNVNGGAIALGHPIGASGARILTTLLYQMKRQKAKRGLATLCIGGGMGITVCVEGM
jgi:acetyl-CoA C-acetyltransferase